MLKKILIGVVGLIVVLILIGFMLPGQLDISRSITMNAPAEYAFEEINTLPNNAKWSYWNSIYPQMSVTYGDVTSGVGAVMNWDGEDSGKGSMTITESIPDKSIKMDLDFMEQGTAKAWYTFEPDGEGTKITTGFHTDFGMNIIGRLMAPLFITPEMNKACDYNLAKLKELAEAKPKFSVAISEENTSPVNYIGISTTMSYEDMNAVSAQMSKSYGELMGAAAKAKVALTGYPFCIYTRWDETKKDMDMVCALPVPADAKLPAKYKIMQTTGGLAVKAIHKGAYETMEATHNQINQYIAYKKLEMNGPVWEIYVTDPELEKDTTKWITEVYYAVKRK